MGDTPALTMTPRELAAWHLLDALECEHVAVTRFMDSVRMQGRERREAYFVLTTMHARVDDVRLATARIVDP